MGYLGLVGPLVAVHPSSIQPSSLRNSVRDKKKKAPGRVPGKRYIISQPSHKKKKRREEKNGKNPDTDRPSTHPSTPPPIYPSNSMLHGLFVSASVPPPEECAVSK